MKYAENYQTIHNAFSQINFAAYDYDTIKSSLIEYIRVNYPEDYNNFIENDHLIMFIETIAYVTELLAFRMDMNANENFIMSTQRKKSILNLAKLTAYKPIRNIAASGLMKLKSISTTANIYDSNGVNINGQVIQWNDSNNSNWFNQFISIINSVSTSPFGQPGSIWQNNNSNYELYSINTSKKSSGIIIYKQDINRQSYDYELVPCTFDSYGSINEQFPDKNNLPSLLYINDSTTGLSGFYFYTKQGTLKQEIAQFNNNIINRSFTPSTSNINQSDVWVANIDAYNNIISKWYEVNNIMYNDNTDGNVYEVETLDNDNINIRFGGQTSNIPQGLFAIYTRQSINKNITSSASEYDVVKLSDNYIDASGNTQTITYELQMSKILSNSIASQSLDDIREKAIGIYGTNDRMVSAYDYNNWIKQLPGIKNAKSINRTYIGDSLFNDATGEYKQLSLIGNDLMSYIKSSNNKIISNVTSDRIIDSVLEPILSTTGLSNSIILEQSLYDNKNDKYAQFKRNAQIQIRDYFINDYDKISSIYDDDFANHLLEKNMIQGYIDQHYYGNSNTTTNDVLVNDVMTNSKNPIYIVKAYYNKQGLLEYYDRLFDAYKLICVPVYNFDEKNPEYTIISKSLDSSISGLQNNIPIKNNISLRYEMFSNKVSDGILTSLNTVDISDMWFTMRVISISELNVKFELINSKKGTIEYFTFVQNIQQTYNIDCISFKLDGSFNIGDTFVFNTNEISGILSTNTIGRWIVIDYKYSDTYNPQINDWHIYLEKSFNNNGTTSWTIYYRDTQTNIFSKNINIESSSTYVADIYNQIGNLDYVSLNNIDLKTSTNLDKTTCVSGYRIPNYFSKFINSEYILGNNIIYTKNVNNNLLLINKKEGIEFSDNILDNNPVISNYNEYNRFLTLNKNPLAFVYNHFINPNILINPSTSNIHDVFMITDTYYYNMINYLITGINKPEREGRIYLYDAQINKHKTSTDEVICRGAEIVPILGTLSDPKYRIQIVVTKNDFAKSNNFIINSICNYINSIGMLDIGKFFYISTITRGLLNNIEGISDVNIISGFTQIDPYEYQSLIPYINSDSIIFK